ncbi:unnamed protein product [Caretta caretta]
MIQSDSEGSDINSRNTYDTSLLVAFTDMLTTVECRFWARETSTKWWDHIVMLVWDDEQGLQNFRMRKATFMGLCEELAPTLRRKVTRLRAALTVEKGAAIAFENVTISLVTLQILSTYYDTIGNSRQLPIGR